MQEPFLQAMSRAANSVCVVTTDGEAGRAGVTVSAMTSVSVDTPLPSLLVCIHNLSSSCAAIQRNQAFCANLLSSDQAHVSDCFAGRTDATGDEKFACAEWDVSTSGALMLRGAQASFDCALMSDVLVGSHRIFVGQTRFVRSADAGAPLIHYDRDYAHPVKSGS